MTILFDIENEPYNRILSRLRTVWVEISKKVIRDFVYGETFTISNKHVKFFFVNLHKNGQNIVFIILISTKITRVRKFEAKNSIVGLIFR